jgi:D-inositol-3-phosphate glycosyltransferase
VLQAFHVLRTYLKRDACLVLIGPVVDAGYAGCLSRFVLELVLPDVVFTSDLTDPQIAFVYGRADVVMSMALDGPVGPGLIEAMGCGIPILARGPGVIRELVGDAGIVIDDLEPVLAAEALARILDDEKLRLRLERGSRRRAEELARGDFVRRFMAETGPAR